MSNSKTKLSQLAGQQESAPGCRQSATFLLRQSPVSFGENLLETREARRGRRGPMMVPAWIHGARREKPCPLNPPSGSCLSSSS